MFGTFAQLPYVYNNIVPRGHICGAMPQTLLAPAAAIVGYPRLPHLNVLQPRAIQKKKNHSRVPPKIKHLAFQR